MGIAVSVKNVKKSFREYYDRPFDLKDKILFKKRSKYENKVVLDGISFDIEEGEAVGLIGKNGCGKSTTLKMLSRIMYPDSGSVTINGKVVGLIELGAGFHPDMTGRENIYINASIFGFSRKEIDNSLQDIIDFSELGDAIDTPIRCYSSGMYMRLAFSVAINVKADVLLIDEILAVGDIAYQEKCYNKLKEIKRSGVTVIIVSHSLDKVEELCDRCIWIKDGRIEANGNPTDIISQYSNFMLSANE